MSTASTFASAHGILLLDKPVGVSSFQALYPVKRLFRGSKIGHAGTLDPAASGLLVVGVGAGTRLLEFLEGLPKRYRFKLRLGIVTDTYDMEGEILERHKADGITREAIGKLLDRFRGSISQLPPAYSAVKIAGRRACDRVRAGEAVTLKPRTVRVDRLEITGFEPGVATLELDCSKGTYVRSIAHDLGQLLGCGAAADEIRRLEVGPFKVEDAVPPPAREHDEAGEQALLAALLPMSRAVAHLPAVRVKDSWIVPLRNGNTVPAGGYAPVAERPPHSGGTSTYAVLAGNDALLAVAEINPLGQLLPRKILAGT